MAKIFGDMLLKMHLLSENGGRPCSTRHDQIHRANLATFPLQTIHALHYGVSDELRIREQHALAVINDVKVNNEKIFTEKAQTLKEKEDLEARSHNLEATITQVCNSIPKLQEDATTTTKI